MRYDPGMARNATVSRRNLLAGAIAPAIRARGPEGRGVVLLIGDDHSPVGGCFGNRIVATPNLDRLARQGALFTNAFCTAASCSPSRSAMLAGLHNHTSGQYGLAQPPHNFHSLDSVESLPRLARAAGVRCGLVGELRVNPPAVYPWDFEGSVNQANDFRDVHSMAREAAGLSDVEEHPAAGR